MFKLLISCNIDAILDVLSWRFEEFWPIYIIAKECSTTNATTFHRIKSRIPQEPQSFVAFVVYFQEAKNKTVIFNYIFV